MYRNGYVAQQNLFHPVLELEKDVCRQADDDKGQCQYAPGRVAGGLRAVVPKISYRTAVILQLTVWLVNSASGVLRAKHMHTNARIKYIL